MVIRMNIFSGGQHLRRTPTTTGPSVHRNLVKNTFNIRGESKVLSRKENFRLKYRNNVEYPGGETERKLEALGHLQIVGFSKMH